MPPSGFSNRAFFARPRILKPPEAAHPSNRAMGSTPASGATPAAERDLVERAKARDQAAFEELVDRHRDRAYGLALRILRSAPDAEEVAQDGFVRAWLALPGFRGESSFGTWLYRIVARRAFDRAEVLKRRRTSEVGIEAADSVASPRLESEAEGRSRRIERMMAELTEAQRAAITLFYYEGRSVEQVAETLGMPTGTVKTHLSRARAAMRKEWLKQERTDR